MILSLLLALLGLSAVEPGLAPPAKLAAAVERRLQHAPPAHHAPVSRPTKLSSRLAGHAAAGRSERGSHLATLVPTAGVRPLDAFGGHARVDGGRVLRRGRAAHRGRAPPSSAVS